MVSPLELIRRKGREFARQGGLLSGMRNEVSRMQFYAKQNNRLDVLPELQERADDLTELFSQWNDTMGRLRGLERMLQRIPGMRNDPIGLGVVPLIPVAVIAVATAVSFAMVAVMSKIKHQRLLLDEVRAGVLTPEQAAELGRVGSIGFPKLLAGGGIGLLGLGLLAMFVLTKR